MTKSKVIVPSEEFEQTLLAQWLESLEYKFTAIPNAIPSKAWRLKHARAGLRAGLPDMLVVLKSRPGLLWIEMKRCKPATSKLSAEQRSWQESLNLSGCQSIVCYGFEEARAAVLKAETNGKDVHNQD